MGSRIAGLVLLSGCATMPTGPSVVVLPGSRANFEDFRADDYDCRNFALRQIGGETPEQAATGSAVQGAAVGAGVGAAAGAAFGGGEGAAIGAGTGLLAGTLFGSEAANRTYSGTQYSYDANYIQCMYAKGHRVPVYGNLIPEIERVDDYDRRGGPDDHYKENRQSADIPPPPPGQPPPAPPGVEPPD